MEHYSKTYAIVCLYFLSYLVEMALTSQVNKLTVFKPTDIQGCAVWFDAYDSTTVTLSGTNVTSWQSKGYNAIQATASGALSPTYSNYTPGNPGLYFNGANKMTTGGATYGTSGMTWITASLETVRVTADAAAVLATNGAGAERSVRYNVNVSDANIYTINSSVIRQLTGENTPGVRGFTDTAATFKAYVNGTATTVNTAVTYQSAVNQGFQLGQWNIGYLTGYIFECIVYDTALSLSDYQKVEGYLAWKWGFQSRLAAGHPYLTNAFAPLLPHLPYTVPMLFTKSALPTPYSARAVGQMNKFTSPPAFPNCVLWLDATDVNGTGVASSPGTVTSWVDKSGSNNSSTAASGSPTLTANSLNSKPGIVFSGASNSYIQVPRVVTDDFSIFVVFSTTATGPNSTPTPGPGQAHTDSLANHWWGGLGIFDAEVGGTQNDFGISLCGSPSAYLAFGQGDFSSATDTTEFSAVAVNTGAGFIGEIFRTRSSGLMEMYVNGAFQVRTTGSTASRNTTNIKIGSIQSLPAGYYFTGTIYEIICYTSILTPTQRKVIEGYLAWKWGRQGTLPSDHIFTKYPPIA